MVNIRCVNYFSAKKKRKKKKKKRIKNDKNRREIEFSSMIHVYLYFIISTVQSHRLFNNRGVHFPQSRSALPPSFVKYNTKKTYPCLTPGECFRERVDILRGSGTDNYELNKQTLRLRQKFHSSSVRRGVWLKGESCIYIYIIHSKEKF